MEWLVLVIATILYCICAYITYQEEVRKQWWFIPFGVLLGTTLATMWFLTIRYIGDKQRIYVFSLFWDTIMWSIYYILPAVFFGVKLNSWTSFGLALIVAGLLVVKLKG